MSKDKKQDKGIQGNVFDLNIIKRLFQYLKPYKFRFVALVVITCLSSLLVIALPYLTGYSINQVILKKDYEELKLVFYVLLAVLAAQALLQFFSTYLAAWLGQSLIKDIRDRLYKHVLNLKLTYFDRTPIGQLVTRNVSDIETISEVFTQGLAALIAESLQVVVILVFMLALNWKLALISLAVFPLLIFSTYVFKEKMKDAFFEVRQAVSKLNTFVQEHVTGMGIVQAFNAEKREYEKFKTINQEHRKANVRTVKYFSIYFPIAEVISSIGMGLLVWFGGKGVVQGWANPGDLVAYIMFIQMFFRPIRMIADRFNTLQSGIVSMDRVFKLLDHDFAIPDHGNLEKESLQGKVVFRDVWFAYKDEDWVLKGIDFDVKEGQTVAFVGETGAGKSSIINLLTRLYEINKGEIIIDDKDIKEYKLTSFRQHIGVVLQDVFLFSDTIRGNVTLGKKSITDDAIWAAAEEMGITQFLKGLPNQLDFEVKERGGNLSVGQRQLISFLRAMVYDPDILILDEATSSIDTETEELIQRATDKLMEGRTSVVIAHRLSTIQKAEQIIVLDKGEVMEAGSHDELRAQKGMYYELLEKQHKNVLATR